MTDISVNASKEYIVHIGKGIIKDCGKIVSSLIDSCKILIVTDTNVGPLYLNTVINSLSSCGFECISYTFLAGEKSKNMNTLSSIWEFAAENELTRKDCMLALGGGVVGDVTGFAAATYMRGIPCIQVPTSLLATVDSSVGGKTAVDLKCGKNLAGVFSQPITVICDTDTLKTLPDHFLIDGIAECIKYGILGNKVLLKIFEDLNGDYNSLYNNIETVIAESVKMKSDFVIKDEFDKGARQFLNLGHTLGHAIEKNSNFEISHGCAVAIGMTLISKIGESIGITKVGTTQKIENILKSSNLPTESKFSGSTLITAISNDKKRSGEEITLVIPTDINSCILKTFNIVEFENIVTEMIK